MRFLETPPEGAGGDLLDGIDMKLLYRCVRRTHLCAMHQGQGSEVVSLCASVQCSMSSKPAAVPRARCLLNYKFYDIAPTPPCACERAAAPVPLPRFPHMPPGCRVS